MAAAVAMAILSVEPLGFPFKTLDPFLFCVYHKDNYPAGNAKMQAPRCGNGNDFDPAQPYRMYHGDRIPGFPQHPHRGFETVTATMEGIIDHTDSSGCAGRYGHGDLQWMTAGKGVVHGEMFPLINEDKPNTLRLFQIWLNLPRKSKMVDPHFTMHWAGDIPRLVSDDGLTKATVWAGSLFGAKGLAPPPASWAADEENDVGIWLFEMQPGARWTLPEARPKSNRTAYFFEGQSLEVAGRQLNSHCLVNLVAQKEVELYNPASVPAQVLVLQGKPIGEPVAQRGPFVMNTAAEISQAFSDYQRTQFGGWPWPEDAVVFPREKGRFALQNGQEAYPKE